MPAYKLDYTQSLGKRTAPPFGTATVDVSWLGPTGPGLTLTMRRLR